MHLSISLLFLSSLRLSSGSTEPPPTTTAIPLSTVSTTGLPLSTTVGSSKPTTEEVSDADVLRGLAASSLERAAKWLEERRGRAGGGPGLGRPKDQGWGAETPRAVLAMRAARSCWGDESTQEQAAAGQSAQGQLEGQLALKQLEVDLAVKLLRNPKEPLSAGHLSLHTLAWTSACMDPRDFHGHDLVGMLQHSQPRHGFEEALVTLAICSSGSQPRKKHLRHLLDLAHVTREKSPFYTDTLSMTLVSLRCLSDHPKTSSLGRYINTPLGLLESGSLSGGGHNNNLFKTSLVVQALGAGKQDNGESGLRWLAYLLGHQRADGSFGSLFATTEVMLALDVLRGGKGLLGGRQCCRKRVATSTTTEPTTTIVEKSDNDDKIVNVKTMAVSTSTTIAASESSGDEDVTVRTTVTPKNEEQQLVNITYWLWVGGEAEERHSLEMIVAANSTFFEVMNKAAILDADYKFSVSDWPNGHYVHTIGGRREQPIGFHFWLLYELDSPPDPSRKPNNDQVAPAGVDELLVQEGKHYLFWYKAI